MGFFDDLDRDVPDPIDVDTPLEEPLFADALDRVEGGWVFTEVLLATERHRVESPLEEEVELRFTSGRYLYAARLVERFNGATVRVRSETKRWLDREGVVELLQDQRRVGRRLVEAAGGRMPGDIVRR